MKVRLLTHGTGRQEQSLPKTLSGFQEPVAAHGHMNGWTEAIPILIIDDFFKHF